MTPRDRTLTLVLIGLITLGGGAVLGYLVVFSPLEDKQAAAQKLQNEIHELQTKINGVNRDRAKIAAVKRQSLPPDINMAKAQYKLLLEKMLRRVGITDHKIPDSRVLDSRAPITPELPAPSAAIPAASTPQAGTPAAPATPVKKQPAYIRLEFKVEAKKADIWQIADFLKAFYEVDLLHQITYINITRDNKPTEARNGLDMHLTIEAIILDKAEPRKSLDPPPVTNAELANKRDYSFLAWKDIFYGILPPPVTAVPLSIARIDSITLERDEKPAEVKVRLSGEGATGAKIVATASGSLLPEGELKVDPKTNTITIPGVGNEDTPESATSTISIVVTSAESVRKEASFKVYVAKPKIVEVPKPPPIDIASAIKLVILSGRSDGTAKAVIFDAANPFKFEITTTGKKVEVLRYWQATGKTWKKDLDYEQPAGVLAFADDFSSTKRTFKVLAFEDDAVIVSETARPEVKSDAKGAQPPRPGGPRPPGPAPAPKQGPADPLAVVAGNVATAIPAPTLYRWTLGKSLQELTKIPPAEAKAILKRLAEADRPAGDATATAKPGN